MEEVILTDLFEVKAAKYEDDQELIKKQEATIFVPSSSPVASQQKLPKGVLPRILEDEGLYTQKKPETCKKICNKMENRLLSLQEASCSSSVSLSRTDRSRAYHSCSTRSDTEQLYDAEREKDHCLLHSVSQTWKQIKSLRQKQGFTSTPYLRHKGQEIPKYFRLDQLQDEFNFVSEEEMKRSKRFQLLELRNAGQLDLFLLQQMPLYDNEIPDIVFQDTVHPFIEVSFQHTVYQTNIANGSHPCWNEEIKVDFISPGHDYSFSSLSKIKDNIHINVFDEVVIEKHEFSDQIDILQRAQTFTRNCKAMFPSRRVMATVFNGEGMQILVTRYIKALNPPQQLLDIFLHDSNATLGHVAYVLTQETGECLLWNPSTGQCYKQFDPFCPLQSVDCLFNDKNVTGFPIQMPYTDVQAVIDAVYQTGVHSSEFPQTEFALAVYIHPYPNNILSVWIYLASLARHQ
ncbi:rCG57684 [Rattus norvegicus]|uniref:RCG57684 n=1 Tax=Rattus norvegicus TaxID=10116 RepID=A6JH63_RAT|nr:rCG57684 [Rattus norvegicus]